MREGEKKEREERERERERKREVFKPKKPFCEHNE